MGNPSNVPKLEEYDFLRVSKLLSDYQQHAANRVSVRIPMVASLFGSFVSVRVDIDAQKGLQRALQPTALLEAWIEWMPAGQDERRVISVTEARAYADDKLLRSMRVTFSSGSAQFFLEDPADWALAQTADRFIIEFVSPSIYFLLPERQPFTRSMLNLQLDISCGTGRTIFYLDYPVDMSLRCRNDNSEYHSLAYATDSNLVRKISFIPNRTIRQRLFWGTNDINKLMGPVTPLYAFGISLLTASFTLLLLEAGLQELGATVFALSLLPPYFQLISGKRIMFPSADIRRFSYDDWLLLLSLVIYLPLMVLTALGLILPTIDKRTMTILDGGLGFVFIIFLLLYILLLGEGVFQHYACDTSEERIWLRRFAKLDLDTRRTLCNKCWARHLASKAVDQPEADGGVRSG